MFQMSKVQNCRLTRVGDLPFEFYRGGCNTFSFGTGGKVRWLKKSSNETCLTWSHMHLILKWLKIRTIHFSLFFGSKYWSRVFWPKWLTFFSSKMLKWLKIRIIFASNSISLRILSHLNIFKLKKSEPL